VAAIEPADVTRTTSNTDMIRQLTGIAERRLGAGARITSLQRLSGGASQELWSFVVLAGQAEHKLVMRRNPGGVGRAISASMETEADVMRLARASGAPVPMVMHVLEPADGLGPGFIMERIEGESLAPRILREPAYAEARPKLAWQLGQAAARIHAVTPPVLRFFPADVALDKAEAEYRAYGVARAVVEWALRWLRHHLPAGNAPAVVVHGDLRHGNIMVGPEGLRAVLDWEGVHLGDPMEDLGWLCVTSWRFGEIDKPVGGFGSREDLFAGYEAAGGCRVDPARVRFWEVLGTLRWGLTCALMADEFRQGDPSVEKAAIGRRASETELDLLAMLAPRGGYRHA
jgi:aminoglycoside phosphotransferase (APT) family kinase protein